MDSIYEKIENANSILRKTNTMYGVVCDGIEYEMGFTSKSGIIHIISKQPLHNSSVLTNSGFYRTEAYLNAFPYYIKKELYAQYNNTIYPVIAHGVIHENWISFTLGVPHLSYEEGKKQGYHVEPYMYPCPVFDVNASEIGALYTKNERIEISNFNPEISKFKR